MSQSPSTTKEEVKSRRKKAIRACSHCQKAHLTCDDARPCQRCIKRGLENTCVDGIRKKAKYLQEDENDDSTIQSTPIFSYNNNNNDYINDSNSMNSNRHNVNMNTVDTLRTNTMDTIGMNTVDTINSNNSSSRMDMNNGFHSMSAINEYGMLSNMIQYQPPANHYEPTTSMNDPDTIILNTANQSPNVPSNDQSHIHNPYGNDMFYGNNRRVVKRRKGIGSTPEEIYTRVQRPYNYAESYHHLIQYVKQRMSREGLMKISRALVIFRPSYMSLVASLTEIDLIYMEKCVQRTLLEYEKLISFSGTPTAVWRRTGELVLVGKEFSLLTQWTKEALLGKTTYIYELMDNGSAIEYWEKFSQHAFDNVESGVNMSIILMSPSHRPIPCSFCFTLKRDIFDLPSVVIGNFLPILGVHVGQ
ncbi:hypothetical protein BDB01DRAFT_768714 [Pilobolus umbonatus]|nr:hypothetical protein BDB01DRAFT_768714 [Pilobolus umbonatus]